MSDDNRTVYYLIERHYFTGWSQDNDIEFGSIKEAHIAMDPNVDQRIVKITKEVVW